MGKVIAAIVGIVFLFLLCLVFTPGESRTDTRAVKAYLDSRGAAPLPRSLRGKIGQGI